MGGARPRREDAVLVARPLSRVTAPTEVVDERGQDRHVAATVTKPAVAADVGSTSSVGGCSAFGARTFPFGPSWAQSIGPARTFSKRR